jgi:endonuclease YncB( thermonuclease family)
MGFRFSKSVKIFPGVRVNLGMRGVNSVSVGKAGASLNIGKKGTRATVGLPGTGLSFSEKLGRKARPGAPPQKSSTRALLLIVILLIAATVAFKADAETLQGRVIGVSDGDTITILDAQKAQHKIRLAEIDAPESHQAFGEKSKQALSALVFNREVTVVVATKDRYGRDVGRVYVNEQDVNAEQVRAGMAWIYTRYASDAALAPLEQAARAARLGLWADASPIPPWEFRHNPQAPLATAERKTTPPATTNPAPGFTCAGKTKCGQMVSCAEARFYLTQCGASRLDRDRDGVPCEKLCR